MAETPISSKPEACDPVGKRARLIAAQRLADLAQWSQVVTHPADSHGLHHLRIAVKRLRYTLEIFAEVLPETCRTFLPELERLQDELGTLHDSDLLIALLQHWRQKAELPAAATAQHEGKMNGEESQSMVAVRPDLLAALGPVPLALLPALETLLQRLRREREQQFALFQLHWQTLEAEQFRQRLLKELAG